MVVNNQFGMGTSLSRHSAVTDLQRKGESLGVPGMRCDGMDVRDTYAVVSEAVLAAVVAISLTFANSPYRHLRLCPVLHRSREPHLRCRRRPVSGRDRGAFPRARHEPCPSGSRSRSA